MSGPSFWSKLADKAAIALSGGVRVRVWLEGTRLVGSAIGRTPGPPPDRLVKIVLELEPRNEGTVDLVHEPRGSWRVSTRGALADPRLEQRIRNVLGNS